MDDRGYLAQALFERLRADAVDHRVLDDTAGRAEIVVARDALAGIPRRLARFSQELDLRLVQLLQPEHREWRFVLAWNGELGRPRFIVASLYSDWYRASRRWLGAEELLRDTPEVRFAHLLIEAVYSQRLDAAGAARLTELWHAYPPGAMEAIARFWRRPADVRLLGQAARHGDWAQVQEGLAALRASLLRARMPDAEALFSRVGAAARALVHPERVRIAFIGGEAVRAPIIEALRRELAPGLGSVPRLSAHSTREEYVEADIRIVFDDHDHAARYDEALVLESSAPIDASVANVSGVVLRWLECRVERRNPVVLVGENPHAARWLQFACRHRIPIAAAAMQTLLNCRLDCRLGSPILMPHPYGIVVERGTVIGSRVTLMQQASLGRKALGEPGVPVIEDNVTIGAGARVLGRVRIGRGATVGANAVVTRDVPSHCTVVGANRILGQRGVAASRQEQSHTVVNT
ncbi:MAG TPA: serine acetyltransferase [Burkholderiales bacterium]